MKLVQLLASGVSEWHDRTERLHQDGDGRIYATCRKMPKFHKEWNKWDVSGHEVIMNGEDPIYGDCLDLADDYKINVVTRAQWQAERNKQKVGEWKRHRGGKCPVPAGTKVSTRHRDGEVVDVHFQTAEYGTHKAVMDCVWKHDGSKHDIMAYKVISQPQAEEVVVKDTTIGTLSYKVEIDTTEASQAIYELAAKWDQVDGPLLWRDTVNELDAYIEEFTREREALINRLALEGFALIPAMTAVMGVADVDMGDWRNWQEGDVVKVIEEFDRYEIGDELYFNKHDFDDYDQPINLKGHNGSSWPETHQVEFVSRP